MTRLKIYITTIFAFFVLLSCQKDNTDVGGDMGTISLSINSSPELASLFSVSNNDMIFGVTIKNAENNEIVSSYDNHFTMPDKISLERGKYIIEAQRDNDKEAGFDLQPFYGKSDIDMTILKNINVEVECKYSMTKVGCILSNDLIKYINTWSLDISNTDNASLTIDNSNKDKSAFIKSKDGNLKYKFSVTPIGGVPIIFEKTLNNIKDGDYVVLKFNSQGEEQTDPDYNTHIEIDVEVLINNINIDGSISNRPKKEKPVLTPLYDNANSIEISAGSSLDGFKISSVCAEGLKSLYIFGHGDLMHEMGFPTIVDVFDEFKNNTGSLDRMSISFKSENKIISGQVNQTISELDLSNFIANLPSDEENERYHELTLLYIDKVGQTAELKYNFIVKGAPIRSLTPVYKNNIGYGEDNLCFTTVVFNGNASSDIAKTSLTFKYREKNGEWNEVPNDQIESSGSNYSASLNLRLNREYEYVAVAKGAADGADLEASRVINVKTIDGLQVVNSSFDIWNSDAKNWYPNQDASNSYWATGNQGVTMLPGKSANTVPEDVLVVKGRAAKLTTLTGILYVNVAAGNIFTGEYKTNIQDPINSVKFGREFTGRPEKFKGYYMYKPGLINGKSDYCHIYLKLENRNGGVVTEVGYCELKDNSVMSEYKPFDLVVNYINNLPVTHVTMVATSSVDGGNFIGGDGSTLYVDQFELVY